ncbi:MAG: ABC transporter substrate-binding protein [Chloroflexi bacterium]|nr:ABC transporter substrate-binding protein [Chloroflexota bacterium]
MPPLADEPKRLTRRRFLRLAALGAGSALGLLQGCTSLKPTGPKPEQTAAPTATPGRVLTIATLGDVASFDSFNLSDLTASVVGNLHNTLIRLDPGRRAVPDLAERWSIADDGRTLQIQLRAGVKFHSGRNITAEDLKANLDRARDWQRGLSVRSFAADVKAVEVKDHYTVAVSFDQPFPLMLDLMDVLGLADPDAFQRFGERDGGTGPFWLAERAPGHHATLKRFDSYWVAGRPLLDTVVVRFFSDEEAITAALTEGSVDFASGLAARARPSHMAGERLPVPKGLHALVLNPSRPPFDRREVRQAVQWAIDRRALASETLAGTVDPAVSFFPSGSPAFAPDLAAAVRFDPERARQLLGNDAVGPDRVTLLVGQQEQDWGRIAGALSGWLESAGLPLEVWPATVAQWYAALNSGNFHAALVSLDHTVRHPAAIAWNLPLRLINNPLWPGGLPAAYADAVKVASTTLDESRQRQTWRAIQQSLLDEAWVIPLAWHYRHAVSRRPIDDLAWTLGGQLLLQDAALRQ